ncbi:class I SAM-dependent methyltransferase [Paenibacillus sp. NPDC056579]|uniref:class I SAM-dependent methyltransferase n=1 Tax=Paenibacillus sp. NPDC056579 TaxID=3345871 RepID=UPI0036B65037
MAFPSSIKTTISDKLLFLRKFIQNPADVGSVIPSSSSLTLKMMESVPWNQVRNVVELGAGTGVFTQAMYELARPDCRVAVFEKDAEMRRQLIKQYSDFHILEDAMDLRLSLTGIGMEKADCIISGLPFANFYPLDREQIIRQVKESLSDDGMFITFQYSLQMKRMLEQHFRTVRIAFVPWNVPPAFVYICQ